MSETAIEALAKHANRSTAGIHAITKGNPFFVTEVLKNEDGRVPATVRDAILTRAARNFMSKTLDALGAEPDDALMDLEPELREALVIGRPFPSPGISAQSRR